MLVEFRVANYKSLKDEQVLSMVASADRSMPENTIDTGALRGSRILRSAVIYGANASGKSNLIDALRFVASLVTGSVARPAAGTAAQPFRLDAATASAPSCFELTIVVDGTRYQYGFSVDRERVHEEWLIAYPKGKGQTWFERPPDGIEDPVRWYFGPGLKGEKRRLVSLVRSDTLFLSVAASFAHEQLTPLHTWFRERLRALSMANPVDELMAERFTARMIQSASGFRQVAESLVRFADLGMTGIEISQRSLREQLGNELADLVATLPRSEMLDMQQPIIALRHSGSDAGEGQRFEPEEESRGTRRFVALLGPWLQSLAQGWTLVVDELDTSLHPSLLRRLVALFHSDLARNAQLVFSTQDTSLLDPTLFRRDQIWFVERDRGGASHLYPLLGYRPRKGEALAKGYLQGRYGAIPFLGELGMLDLHAQA